VLRRFFLFLLLTVLFLPVGFSLELSTDELLKRMQDQLSGEDLGKNLYVLTVITEDRTPGFRMLFILTTDAEDIPLYVGAISSNGAVMPVEKREKEDFDKPVARSDMKLWKIPYFIKGVVFNTSGDYKIVKLGGWGEGDYRNGGRLHLSYMVSGATGLRKRFTFRIVKIETKEGVDWKLFSDKNTGKKILPGERIDRMHFVVNKFLWIPVGIKRVLFNEDAEKRFLRL